jgi:hypothetical protein
MRPLYTIRQARDCLRERFGPVWQAPYAAGKAQMARWLAGNLEVPQEQSTQVVEELERNGTLRFVSATGRTASPPAYQKAEPATQRPLKPDVVAPAGADPAPEMGMWQIA